MSLRIAVTVLAAGLLAAPAAEAGWFDLVGRHKGVAPVTDELYLEECGACHFAYQPGWLPSRSWTRLIGPEALADHFGDNAELDEADRKRLAQVLLKGAAERSGYKRSRKVYRSLDRDADPLRITETPYIRDKHGRIPDGLVAGNEAVGSLAQCDACHTGASDGDFDDDRVVIPGHGPWTGWRPFSWTR